MEIFGKNASSFLTDSFNMSSFSFLVFLFSLFWGKEESGKSKLSSSSITGQKQGMSYTFSINDFVSILYTHK